MTNLKDAVLEWQISGVLLNDRELSRDKIITAYAGIIQRQREALELFILVTDSWIATDAFHDARINACKALEATKPENVEIL